MRVLLVEDQHDIRQLFENVIRGRGHEVTACADGETAWEAYRIGHHPLILLDWELQGGGMNGLDLCRKIRSDRMGSRCVIIMVTAYDSPNDLQAALQAGANDYLVKPIGVDFLKLRLAIAEEWVGDLMRRLRAEEKAHHLERELAGTGRFYDLIGRSTEMQRVYRLIQELAAVDTTVLIEGETGTGKELVARAIHLASRRKDGPFLPVNCAGFTESILGSQLFGHKKGAFTGAVETQLGVFEAAEGGTIFLDEIGDVPMPVQTSLLRVLQEREITRLGEAKPRRVNVRVLAATHHDLASDIAKGTFRQDLLYRLRVARIHLPALRERRNDIPLLVTAFLGQFRSVMEKPVHHATAQAMGAMLDYVWPGNVRELKSAIEAAVIHCRGAAIEVADLPAEVVESKPSVPALTDDPADERARMLIALKQTKGNRSEAARLLGMSRRTFYRRLSDLNFLPNR